MKDLTVVSLISGFIIILLVLACFFAVKDTKECKNICLENDYEFKKIEDGRSCVCISEEHELKYFNLIKRETVKK